MTKIPRTIKADALKPHTACERITIVVTLIAIALALAIGTHYG